MNIWNGAIDVFWYNSSKKEFVITTAEQLAGLAVLVNHGIADFAKKTVKLGSNIMLNDTKNWRKWDKKRPKNEWIPIGEALTIGGTPLEHEHIMHEFCGVFDGCGFTVSGIYINGLHNCGLFGEFNCGTIKNLGIAESYIKGSFCGSFAGSFSGYMSNCYSTGWVRGERFIGGLVGYNSGDINNCYFAGIVEGKEYVGGMAGFGLAGEDKTTAQMKKRATFAGWDFENVWILDKKINDGYPSLRVEKNGFTFKIISMVKSLTYEYEIREAIIAKTDKELKRKIKELANKDILQTADENLVNVYVYRDEKLVYEVHPQSDKNWDNPCFEKKGDLPFI
jgi:hypothetical protein